MQNNVAILKRFFTKSLRNRNLVPVTTMALLLTTGCGTKHAVSRPATHLNATEPSTIVAIGSAQHTTGNSASPGNTSPSRLHQDGLTASAHGNGSHGNQSIGSRPAKIQIPKGTSPTVASLASPYIGQLEQLKATYLSEANSLYNEAIEKHSAHVESNRALYNEEYQKGMALEDDAQARVNQILFGLKDTLQENHLPTKTVDDLRNQYYVQVQSTVRTMATMTSGITASRY